MRFKTIYWGVLFCFLFFLVSCSDILNMAGDWEVTIEYGTTAQLAVFEFDEDGNVSWWIDTDAFHEPTIKQCMAWDGFRWGCSDKELTLSGTGTLVGTTPCGEPALVAWLRFDDISGFAEEDSFTVMGTVSNSRGASYTITIKGYRIN